MKKLNYILLSSAYCRLAYTSIEIRESSINYHCQADKRAHAARQNHFFAEKNELFFVKIVLNSHIHYILTIFLVYCCC